MPRTAAIRQTAPREIAQPVERKTRLRKNASARSLLDIPSDIVAKIRDDYGQDLQWVTDSILGKEENAIRQSFEINAWEPVTPDMFDSVFDGMYTKKGHKGEINYQGLVLMYRPYELTEEAREEERRDRHGAMEAQRNMVKNGIIPGLSSSFEPDHPTALAKNKFNRSMEIPTD